MLSVTFVVAERWLLLGVSAKAIMSITGTRRPMREYSSGLLELRQARHQTIAKMTEIMMIKIMRTEIMRKEIMRTEIMRMEIRRIEIMRTEIMRMKIMTMINILIVYYRV